MMQTAGILLALAISNAAQQQFLEEVREDLREQGGIFLEEEKNKRRIIQDGGPPRHLLQRPPDGCREPN